MPARMDDELRQAQNLYPQSFRGPDQDNLIDAYLADSRPQSSASRPQAGS